MKIKLPEFRAWDDDMIKEDAFWATGIYFTQEYNINDFPFECTISFDGGHGDNDSFYMYGFISHTEYFDDAIVNSDDIVLPETKTGKLRKSDIKKAYNTIVKQLKIRYRQWIMGNIIEEVRK